LTQKWVVDAWMKASRAVGHTSWHMHLQSPHADASLVYAPALCHPGMKKGGQGAAEPGGSRQAVCRLSSTVAIT